MRRLGGAAVAFSLALACAHAKHVAPDEKSKPAKKDEAKGGAEVPSEGGRPPVPAVPDALLRPGGAEQVKEALAARGLLPRSTPGDALDGATAAALRRFQREEGLAATGFPDRETLQKLGLEPSKIYRTTDSEIGSEGKR